jgi:hypothetical protein
MGGIHGQSWSSMEAMGSSPERREKGERDSATRGRYGGLLGVPWGGGAMEEVGSTARLLVLFVCEEENSRNEEGERRRNEKEGKEKNMEKF